MGVSMRRRRETRGGTLTAGGEATVEDARELEVTVAVEVIAGCRGLARRGSRDVWP